ncbi:MAG TPA: outer membrane protein assembly factor BamE, partial [Methylophilaceae bacterium]|nr:outer membrane protein assembly factor BamE [Methylophilaceae bacterium]
MRYITILLLALMSAACSSALPSLKPYHMDIQQGNVVTSKMMLQLRPGMSKSQVRFIMGTPLIQDSFHANRWDYFYEMRKGGKLIERRRVILEFENEALKRVRGDVIPAGTGEPVAEPAPVTESPKAKKAEEKKGLLDRLKFWKSEPEKQKPQEAPAELISPAAAPATEKAAPEAKPEPQPPAAPAETQPEAKPEPAPAAPAEQAPAKDLPEPGEPLGPDSKDMEMKAAPAVEAPKAKIIDESAKPAEPVEPQQPAQAAPAAPEAKPEPAPAETPAPAAEPAPAKTSPAAEPAVKPAPANSQPAQESKPATKSEDDGLPPEEDPGYFERML